MFDLNFRPYWSIVWCWCWERDSNEWYHK